ncbi:MAG: MerR family transcriptional regulator [Planctomycetota bacterium]
MKIYRADEAAERLGLPLKVLKILSEEGRIHAEDTINGVGYYTQTALDRLIQDLHCSIQRASWRDMEARMEEVEQRVERIERELRQQRETSARIL